LVPCKSSTLEAKTNDPEQKRKKKKRNKKKSWKSVMSIIGVGSYSTVTFSGNNQVTKTIDNALSPTQDLHQLSQLLHEIIILSRFNHPNLISSLSIQKNNTNLNINMHASNCDLSAIMKTPRTAALLRYKNILSITYQILSGLRYLHYNNIIHRDLNPRNIFVSTNGSVQIGDFGLSCISMASPRPKKSIKTTSNTALHETKTMSSHTDKNVNQDVNEEQNEDTSLEWRTLRVSKISHTPYSAPEITLDRKKCSPATDIWASGVILTEMLTLHQTMASSSSSPNAEDYGTTCKSKYVLPLFSSLLANVLDQSAVLQNLILIRGGPPEEDVDEWKTMSSQTRTLMKQEMSNLRGSVPLLSTKGKKNDGLLVLAKKMLSYNYKKRVTAREALHDVCFERDHVNTWMVGHDVCGKRISKNEFQKMFSFVMKMKNKKLTREDVVLEIESYL
jgi:serine/threonine protein kinase